jgi:hypothetical protein
MPSYADNSTVVKLRISLSRQYKVSVYLIPLAFNLFFALAAYDAIKAQILTSDGLIKVYPLRNPYLHCAY